LKAGPSEATQKWRKAVLDAHFDYDDSDPDFGEFKRQGTYLGLSEGDVHYWYREQRKKEPPRIPISRTIDNKEEVRRLYREAFLNAEFAYRGLNPSMVELKRQAAHLEDDKVDFVYEWYRRKYHDQLEQGLYPPIRVVRSEQHNEGDDPDTDTVMSICLNRKGFYQPIQSLRMQAVFLDVDFEFVHGWYRQKFEQQYPSNKAVEIAPDEVELDVAVHLDRNVQLDGNINSEVGDTETVASLTESDVFTQRYTMGQQAPSTHSVTSVSTQGKQYICTSAKPNGDICGAILPSLSAWDVHDHTHWPEFKYTCLLCHIGIDLDTRFACNHCSATFLLLKDAKDHVLSPCKPTQRAWKSKNALEKHIAKHREGNYLYTRFGEELGSILPLEKEIETWVFPFECDPPWPRTCTSPGCPDTSEFVSREKRKEHFYQEHFPSSRKRPKRSLETPGSGNNGRPGGSSQGGSASGSKPRDNGSGVGNGSGKTQVISSGQSDSAGRQQSPGNQAQNGRVELNAQETYQPNVPSVSRLLRCSAGAPAPNLRRKTTSCVDETNTAHHLQSMLLLDFGRLRISHQKPESLKDSQTMKAGTWINESALNHPLRVMPGI
jgi:hypothetical protein